MDDNCQPNYKKSVFSTKFRYRVHNNLKIGKKSEIIRWLLIQVNQKKFGEMKCPKKCCWVVSTYLRQLYIVGD